jgi:hypothetical protein
MPEDEAEAYVAWSAEAATEDKELGRQLYFALPPLGVSGNNLRD